VAPRASPRPSTHAKFCGTIAPVANTSSAKDPAAAAAVGAIRAGDLAGLSRLLADHPSLATARIESEAGEPGAVTTSRTLLHVVADWPGHYPNGAATVAALVDAGADVDAAFVGRHSETPLHWAASSDDIAVLDALLDAGADIDARGGCIGDGTPLFDATAFGQWRAARRLVERGARRERWDAAVLDDVVLLGELLSVDPAPSAEEVSDLFWGACHGGARATAEYLRTRGADVNRVGWDNLTPAGAAQRSGATALVAFLAELGAK